jgi:hypothetical protein
MLAVCLLLRGTTLEITLLTHSFVSLPSSTTTITTTIRFQFSKIFAGNVAVARPIASAISIDIMPSPEDILKRRPLLLKPRRQQVKSTSTIPILESFSTQLPRDAVSKTFSRRAGPTAGLVSEVREHLSKRSLVVCETRNDWTRSCIRTMLRARHLTIANDLVVIVVVAVMLLRPRVPLAECEGAPEWRNNQC